MLEAMDVFFESVAWPMTPPPSYGAFHILFTLIGFAVCGVAAWLEGQGCQVDSV